MAAAEPPTREALTIHAAQAAARLTAGLRTTRDEALLLPEADRPWTGATLLDRVIYALRHTTWHLGEVNAILKLHGRPVVDQDC